MNKLIENINSKILLSPALQEVIKTRFQHIQVNKNELLLKENQYCRKLFFLEAGTVRTFYHEKGKDITSWFYKEGQFFTAWYSFYSQKSGFENIEAVENCKIYYIDYFNYQKLLEEYNIFERFGRLLAEEQTAFIDLYSKGPGL